jgi:hypothetical protein
MLKKSASIVLTSFRGSTYRSVRLASSLAAALLEGLSILLTIQALSLSYHHSTVSHKTKFSSNLLLAAFQSVPDFHQ